jgi:hypothetical protein
MTQPIVALPRRTTQFTCRGGRSDADLEKP